MYRVLVTDPLNEEAYDILRKAEDIELDIGCTGRPDLLARVGQYDALIVRSDTIADSEVIKAGKRLTVIGRAGRNLDNIDLETATEQGVMVTSTPNANALSMAEHTLGMLLALSRHIPEADRAVRSGTWNNRQPGVELAGKSLGILGFGNIGQMVSKRANAFDMNVLAYDPYIDAEAARQLNVTPLPFEELLSRADYVSLHVPLTPETEHILDAHAFDMMKDGMQVINCARGGLVDTVALVEALRSGRVTAAALDVFDEFPLPANHPLLDLPNVVLTPRRAADSVEARQAVSVEIVQQVRDALRGTDYRYVVNLPFIEGDEYQQARPFLHLAEKLGQMQAQLADGPIRRMEVETSGEGMAATLKAVTVGLLKGLLTAQGVEDVNYINAPLLASERGVMVAQARGLALADYTNLISCQVYWEDGSRLAAGAVFGGELGRIVQLDDYRLDVMPEGHLLVTRSRDVPGVIGQVGSLLAEHGANIAEWRMGRDHPGGRALSFVNLDNAITQETLTALRELPQVAEARVISFE